MTLSSYRGEIVRDILKRQKRRRGHQELAEEHRRGSGLPQNSDRLFGRPRTGVVCFFHLLDRFENAVLLLEVSAALSSIGEAFAHHCVRLHSVEDVKEVVRVAAHQRSCERDQSLRRASEHAKSVSLRRVAGQLVQFIGDGEIKPPAHVAPDILDWRHALNARPVSLPQCGEACGAAAGRGQGLRDLEFVSEVKRGKLLHLGVEDGNAGIRIDDAAQIRTGLCLEIDVLPEVSQLAFVLARDKERRTRKSLPPLFAAHASHLGHAEALALIHRLAFAQLHLADAVRPIGIAAIAHVLNEEGPGSRYRQQDLARPFVRDMRWAHYKRRAWTSLRENVDRAERHERLARTALGDYARSLCLA